MKDNYSPRNSIISGNMSLPVCCLGQRKSFESIGPWDESLQINQDGEYFNRAIVKSSSIRFFKNTGVDCQVGYKQSESQFKQTKATSLFKSIESFEGEVNKLERNFSLVIARQFQHFAHRAHPHTDSLRKLGQDMANTLAVISIENHLFESNGPKQIARIIGWKTFVLPSQLSWFFFKS